MKQQELVVSKSNIVWLIVILVVGLVAWQAFGWVGGVVAGAVALLVSEIVERRRRTNR